MPTTNIFIFVGTKKGFQNMKETDKTCKHCSPSYKGGVCELKKGKKVKLSECCEKWEGKK
jgi:hypothetical protein